MLQSVEDSKSQQTVIHTDEDKANKDDRLINIVASCIDAVSNVSPPISPINV